MKKRLLSVALLMGAMAANAQVGIGTATPNKSAELLIESSNRGLLIPNVALTSTTDKSTITNGNVESLLVYATKTTEKKDITPGYYYWDGAKWARLTADKDIPKIVSDQFQNILNLNGDKVANLIKGLFSETTTNVDRQKAGKYIYTNEKGTVQTIDVVGDITEILKGGVYPAFDTVLKQFIDKAETVTSLLYNGTTRTLSYTDEDRNVNNIDIAQILKDHTANNLNVKGSELVSTVNGVEGKTDLTNKISNGMLQGGAVTNDKLSAGKGDDNRVAVADKDGNVTYKTQKEIVEGNTSNDLALDGNKLTSTVNGKTSTVSLTENSVVSSKGITGTGIVVDGGSNATLKDVKLSIEDGAITPEKMAKGDAGTVLVTDKDGIVKWVKEDAAIIKDMVKANETITTLLDKGDGTFIYYNEADYGTDGKLKPGAEGTKFDANTLKVIEKEGVYTFTDKSGKELAKIDTNAKASGYNNATSGLTSKDVQGAIDELVGKINTVAGTKGTLSSTDIVVTKGEDAILKDVTLAIAAGAVTEDKIGQGAVTTDKLGAGAVTTEKIAAGSNGQVLVTVTENGKEVTKWVDKKDATSNELTSAGNTMTSNVNGVSKTADIVNSIGNSLDKDNKLVTTVNGKAGEGVDLTPAIQAGQKTTSVDKGSDKVTVVGTTTGKNTEYVVDVVEGELNLGNMGGQVTTTQITDGAVTNEKIAAGKEGQVLVTVTENGKEVTKWMPANDLGNTVTAGNGLTKSADGEIKLGGQLTEKTILTTSKGKELVIEGLEDVKTNPSINNIVLTDPITGELKQTSVKNLLEDTITKGGTADELKAKSLRGDGITVTTGATVSNSLEAVNALLKDVILGIADGAITEGKLGTGAVTTEKIKAGKDGQVLVTEGGVTKWVDKKEATTNEFTLGADNKLVSNVNGVSKEVDLTFKVTDGMLNGGQGTDKRVAVSDKDGKVTYQEVTGKALNGKALTSGSIKVFGGSQALLDGTVIEVQGGTKDGQVLVTTTKEIVVGKDANGADIKETHKVTEWVDQLPADKLTPGNEGQVLVTEGGETKWVDKTPTTNELTKKTIGVGADAKTDNNTIVSNVNGVLSEVKVIDTVGNSLDADNKLVTTVNGVPGTGLDLTPAIQAGQKTTSVINGSDKVTVVTTGPGTTGKNTEYTVDVVEANIKLEELGGQLPADKLAPGTEGQVLVTEGGVTKWVTKQEVGTTNGLKIVGNELISTVNGVDGKADLVQAITADMLKDGSVTADKIDASVAGEGLTKNATTGALDVDFAKVNTELAKGKVSSTTILVNNGVESLNSTFNNVALEIKGGDKDGQVLTSDKDGKVTWTTPEKAATSNELKADGDKLVSTVNGQPAELKLEGDVILKDGKTVVGGIQGTPVSETKPSTDGQALVYNEKTKTWKPGTPNVGVANVTDAKTLTTDGIILVNTDKKVVEKSVLADIELSIANNAITADKLKAGDTNQVLTTVDNAGTKTVEWKTPVVDAGTVTNGRDLTTDGIIVVGEKDSTIALAEGSLLKAAKLSIKEGGITAKELANNAVTTEKIAGDAITSDKIADGTIQTADLDNKAVTPEKVQGGNDGEVLTTTGTGADAKVEWKKPVVDAGTVTNGKALTSTEGTITITGADNGATALLKGANVDVANGAITPAKLQPGNNNQVLTTVDNGGTKTVVWKDKEKPTTVTGGKTETGDVVVTPGTGDKANEFTVDVKSAMPKVFYMPPVVFDTTVKGLKTRNLHEEYLAQFVNVASHLNSTGAVSSIPNTTKATDLDYYVTYHDSSVVTIMSVDSNGLLTYEVIGDSTPATFMTIVFVVK
ncbi:hypothetical protein LNQ81_00910 [Myroides sp. M-43]|uniref:hypothetical protein n=1 Tax=Myroides oncorhynchi TaxID=2893756 RepID=UPI001E5BBE72|nr:hypothetical protein [Myroides oncorhynchi]MCC9041295.1 hypothetical protein [Myroides oncorhynchi]